MSTLSLSPLLPGRSSFRLRFSTILISLGVILWEILITRIFSTIFYYHFAFMAVSLSMFGLTVGAVIASLYEESDQTVLHDQVLPSLAILFSVLMGIAIVVPLNVYPSGHSTVDFYSYMSRFSLLAALAFVPAGAFICLVLTRFQDVSVLYACDLVGAGLGCLVFPIVIGAFGGPGAVLAVASLAALAAMSIAPDTQRRLRAAAGILAVGWLAAGLLNNASPWLRVQWRADTLIPTPLHENWNSFSRIVVHRLSKAGTAPFFWGADPAWVAKTKGVPELFIQIDTGAGTPITSFDGNLEPLQYLKVDLTAFSHYLRPAGDTLVIGPGGGRDVLTALVFGDRSIDAVEINANILHAVNGVFGDFSGHLDRQPQIHFHAEDGRTFVDRSGRLFDIIQASLIDTAAATAAGAYSFTENSLYTVQAWSIFLKHLKPRGVLTFSRWYFGESNWPMEAYRLVGLGTAALRAVGVSDPERHLILVRNRATGRELLSTLMISRDAFEASDIAKTKDACAILGCDVVIDPESTLDPVFQRIMTDHDGSVWAQFPVDLSPPDDNRPYFFFHARLKDFFQHQSPLRSDRGSYSVAVQTLLVLLVMSTGLGIGLIVFSAWALRRQGRWMLPSGTPSVSSAFYFAAIGAAYIFVEIGLMQRLSLYLGHPTYGFVVTLFALLLSSGVGSWLSRGGVIDRARVTRVFTSVIVLIGLAEMASGYVLAHSIGQSVAIRILGVVFIVGLPGLAMGFCFPLGMNQILGQGDPRGAWYWSINGACSVIASVLAITVSFFFGIMTVFLVGMLVYAIAGILSAAFMADRERYSAAMTGASQ